MRLRNAPPPFDLGFRSVRSRQHCGVISLGREAIEVLPKIEVLGASESDVNARSRLLSMLAFTRRLPIHQAEAAGLAKQRHSLLEVFVRLFCTKAIALVRAGMIHRYERQDENLRVLRGKLMFPVHVAVNAARQDRVYCTFDEFTPDNAANQAIKAAARRSAAVITGASTQGMLRELVYSLDEISEVKPSVETYRAIPRERVTQAYRDVLDLTGMILFGPLPDVVSGESAQVALLFDMNKLFEEFIGRHMVRLSPARWRCKGPRAGWVRRSRRVRMGTGASGSSRT
jgi:5-methylcytosine-specific restriction enzyme subunit McrC